MVNGNQVRSLKKQLDEREHALRQEIRAELLNSEKQHYRDLAGRVKDVGEESVADLLVDLQLASVDRHIQEIRDIEAAQTRMVTGSFGICVDCDRSIDAERLEAYPTAKRCRPCQVEHERMYASSGRPSL
ncbi:MAG: TraR/DksA family transcriptional regulator [Xanthomonadales bacterium]|nr:TraR/DksA C4-type zinc finger protein [Gammaproteobacteria bacterium]MBT8073407.1 TraR/DksA C4-type zinc finger protein [Gammaproteobacteria bacterium]MBT8076252.1 TraR/DksA C4-type zinc finger protein [Gammaproteobacteria bacterium]NNK04251.1 TraR/DksA family transcriptional regulator [Xanthomonadales bacterium]